MAQFFNAVKRRVGGEMKDFLDDLIGGDDEMTMGLARNTTNLAAGPTTTGSREGSIHGGAASTRSPGRGSGR